MGAATAAAPSASGRRLRLAWSRDVIIPLCSSLYCSRREACDISYLMFALHYLSCCCAAPPWYCTNALHLPRTEGEADPFDGRPVKARPAAGHGASSVYELGIPATVKAQPLLTMLR